MSLTVASLGCGDDKKPVKRDAGDAATGGDVAVLGDGSVTGDTAPRLDGTAPDGMTGGDTAVTGDAGRDGSTDTATPGPDGGADTSTVTPDSGAPDTTPVVPMSCVISKPTRMRLNGLAAPAGDRVGTGTYQTSFEVTTDIEDGQPVRLEITPAAAPMMPTSVMANVTGGKAVFAAVTLGPDGDYAVQAVCTNRSGGVGRSTSTTFTVDATNPGLMVTSPTSGKFFAPNELVNGKFQVCGTTTSTDAVTGAVMNNLCAGIGTASVCGSVATTGTGNAGCVDLACPGGAPFSVVVTLTDAAGNTSQQTVTNVSCASSLPTVQIVSPTGDVAPFATKAKRLLSVTSGQDLRDLDPGTPGAQTNVVACTGSMGANASLFAGLAGGTLSQVGGTVAVSAAQPSDGCPAEQPYVARFSNVTLPESTQAADGLLTAPTQIRVDVTDPSTASGSSPVVTLWVDSIDPTVTPTQPSPLCGAFFQGTPNATQNVQLTTGTAQGTLTVVGGAMTNNYTVSSQTNGVITFNSVVFRPGENQVTATATDYAGNSAALATPCLVTVFASLPSVTFQAPGASITALCANGNATATCIADSDAVTGGWQGTLSVQVQVDGQPATTGDVTFTQTGGITIGTAPIVAGVATLANATVIEGSTVVITASTSGITGRGAGTASKSLTVDVTPPTTPASLMVTVPSATRRQGVLSASWAAATDVSSGLASYEVRVSKTAITAMNFASAELVGTFASNVTTATIAGRVIETDYYVAVAARDNLGQVSSITTAGPTKIEFNRTILTRPAGGTAADERFGYGVDGSSDLNGDGRSDLLVHSFKSKRVYLYFGTTSGVAAQPDVIFTHDKDFFGNASIVAGDIDADGRLDLAMASVSDNRVYIFKGRDTWPSTLDTTMADYTVSADPAYAGGQFGFVMSRLGDFDGDMVDDFVIGAGSTPLAQKAYVIKGKMGFASITLPDTTNAISFTGGTGSPVSIRVLGLGNFYASTGKSLLISDSRAGGMAGAIYAFPGQTGTAGDITLASAAHTSTGSGGQQRGLVLSPLGAFAGSPQVVGVGNTSDGLGSVLIFAGTAAAGPFGGQTWTITSSAPGTSGFGTVLIGGAFPGTNDALSLFGDPTPDLVIGSTSEGANERVYLIDGSRLGSLPATFDITMNADAVIAFPSDWDPLPPRGGLIRDLNGDAFPDFAVGEVRANIPGRLLVFW